MKRNLHTLSSCFAAIVLSPLALIVLAGCSDGMSGGGVSGTVTMDGKPLERGLINFIPSEGRPLGGPIRADGTYQYVLPPGDYRVTIAAPGEIPADWKEDDPPPEIEPLVPLKYSQARSSGLQLTVPEGSQPISKDFDLQ